MNFEPALAKKTCRSIAVAMLEGWNIANLIVKRNLVKSPAALAAKHEAIDAFKIF